jgi:hypothetical protein
MALTAYIVKCIFTGVPWAVLFHPDFEAEFVGLARDVRIELAARLETVGNFGPRLGRPYVDTLKGSAFANMKELRFRGGGEPWRFAFAFDPVRRAVVLCGGSKAGKSERLFYRRLIELADKRFAQYLDELE